MQQINASRKFNVDVWHLKCRNVREINTVHNIHNTSLHERLFVGQQSSLALKSLIPIH